MYISVHGDLILESELFQPTIVFRKIANFLILATIIKCSGDIVNLVAIVCAIYIV